MPLPWSWNLTPNRISTFTIPLLLITIIYTLPISPAHADAWYGNDDGEFDVGSPGYPLRVGLQEYLTSSLTWQSSPPNNLVSMQYNPDQAISFCCQYFAQWFQTAIISDPNGCGSFTIQVYSLTSGFRVWRADQIFSPCSQGYLAQGATWTIQEDMKSSSDRTIVDVYFSVQTPTTGYSYTLYPGSSSHWIWERSNLCWCGTDGGSTTFNQSVWGLSGAYSDLTVNAIGPPVAVSTSENSNMWYWIFTNSGTTQMSQNFGWCCGWGGGSVALGTQILTPNGNVAVQNLNAGDTVISIDPFTQQSYHSTITSIHIVTVDNMLIFHTASGQPLRVDINPRLRFNTIHNGQPGLWSTVLLVPGDSLYQFGYGWTPITSIDRIYGGHHTYYDLHLAPLHDYIASGYADCPCKT